MGKPIALTAAAFFDWGGGASERRRREPFGTGRSGILKSETSQSPGNAIKPASFS